MSDFFDILNSPIVVEPTKVSTVSPSKSPSKIGKAITFKEGSDFFNAEKLLNPDINGVSKEVPIEEFEKVGLGFGNGGSWCRRDGRFCKKYIVEIIKSSEKGNKIVGIKTNGFIIERINLRSVISQEIREHYKGTPCASCSYNHGKNEIDHKDGYNITGNNIKDFQPLCSRCNGSKRQACIECKKTGKRFDATSLGYTIGWIRGTQIFTKEIGCSGCYWNDCRLFKSLLFIKKK